ncbi:MAG: hypothetical protein ACM3IJ_06175 [Candidatus Levyibacteriota bacterium]
MRARRKLLPLLILGLLSFLGVGFYILVIDPTNFFTVGNFAFSPIIFFFTLLFIGLSSFCAFLLVNLRRGILLSFFLCAILLLRFFGYTNLFSVGILLVIVVLLELGFGKK